MKYDPHRHGRRTIRLPGHDYAANGAYFVTIVCQDRELLFGDPMVHAVVESAWLWLRQQYEYVVLDKFVLMPNHLHGIIVIQGPVGAVREPPLHRARKPLGRLIGAFKTVSTKRINELRDTPGEPVWQRNYYERIIRDSGELQRIRVYITRNPSEWDSDEENPENSHAVTRRTGSTVP